jgi:quinol monooxygenase YgiN
MTARCLSEIAHSRFAKENIDDAMAAFRALASAARQESGNLSYDIYRGMVFLCPGAS